jgi:uncharacterized lipoprotein YmbA
MRRLPCVALFLVLAAIVAACAGGTSSPTYFYTLSPTAAHSDTKDTSTAAAAPAEPAATRVRVAVTQVSIPGTVDRPQLVVRTAPNRVEIADFHRWAEPLREGIARSLAADLAAQQPGLEVSVGEPIGGLADARVLLDVQKFEAVLGGAVTVDALWAVRPLKGEPRSGRSLVEERATTNDYAGVAAAYSRALAHVAQDIGAAIVAQRK